MSVIDGMFSEVQYDTGIKHHAASQAASTISYRTSISSELDDQSRRPDILTQNQPTLKSL